MPGGNRTDHKAIHKKRKVQRNRTLDLLAFLLLIILGTMFFIPLKEFFAAKMLNYATVTDGILEDKITAEGIIIYDAKVVQASASGEFVPVVPEGERVAEGALVGYFVTAAGKKPMYASASGAVSYQIDGLEAVLTPVQADGIDLNKILTLLDGDEHQIATPDEGQPVKDGQAPEESVLGAGKGLFKIVDNLSDVYFLVQVKDADKAAALEPEQRIRIRLPEGQQQKETSSIGAVEVIDSRITATVASVTQTSNGAQVLLKIKRNDIVLSGARKITIDMLLDTIKGNILPNKAIFYNEAGKPCVYVVKKSRLAIAGVEVMGTIDDMSVIEGLSIGTAVVTNPSLAKAQQKVYFK
ncbi:MAG: hypothetical protein HFI72_07545 [Peptococcaceae bacterium]|nr:hypothetical protein [Peptococcaceae bacterium]